MKKLSLLLLAACSTAYVMPGDGLVKKASDVGDCVYESSAEDMDSWKEDFYQAVAAHDYQDACTILEEAGKEDLSDCGCEETIRTYRHAAQRLKLHRDTTQDRYLRAQVAYLLMIGDRDAAFKRAQHGAFPQQVHAFKKYLREKAAELRRLQDECDEANCY
jgi:hypothetical protein